MDLSTKYLGLKLKNPLIVGACSLGFELSKLKEMEDHGAAAIVLPSLFEEEIRQDNALIEYSYDISENTYAESTDFFPKITEFKNNDGQDYLKLIKNAKKQAKIPIIASLNGMNVGGWVKYAKKIEDAGADALELNIYFMPTDPLKNADHVESQYLEIIKSVRESIKIPLAIKLGPYFSSLYNLISKIDKLNVDGIVIFNRFIEPDFSLDDLELVPKMTFSTPEEMRITLHWTAILYSKIKASIGAGRGIKTSDHILKLIMAGADATLVAGALYQSGIPILRTMLEGLERTMKEKEYSSISQIKGSMSYKNVANPTMYERINYIKMLKSLNS